jgi:arsenate reductase
LDLVLTVCDNAAKESCPTFFGRYDRVHWSFPDPAGSSTNKEEERAAFTQCFQVLKSRVEQLCALVATGYTREAIIHTMRAWS